MFLLALPRVDWQTLCLSYSGMFACQQRECCIFCWIIKLNTTKTGRLSGAAPLQNLFQFTTARAGITQVCKFIVMPHWLMQSFNMGRIWGFSPQEGLILLIIASWSQESYYRQIFPLAQPPYLAISHRAASRLLLAHRAAVRLLGGSPGADLSSPRPRAPQNWFQRLTVCSWGIYRTSHIFSPLLMCHPDPGGRLSWSLRPRGPWWKNQCTSTNLPLVEHSHLVLCSIAH